MKSTEYFFVLQILLLGPARFGLCFVLEGRDEGYALNERVPAFSNSLHSRKNLIPLPSPSFTTNNVLLQNSFGQSLLGYQLSLAPLEILAGKEEYCKKLASVYFAPDQPSHSSRPSWATVIKNSYRYSWYLDGLPAMSRTEDESRITTFTWLGPPVGDDPSLMEIYNHFHIEVTYEKIPGNMEGDSRFRIIRWLVQPFSIQQKVKDWERARDYLDGSALNNTRSQSRGQSATFPLCDSVSVKNLKARGFLDPTSSSTGHAIFDMIRGRRSARAYARGNVTFTYDVVWVPVDSTAALEDQTFLRGRQGVVRGLAARTSHAFENRWGPIVTMNYFMPNEVRWFSVANSLLVMGMMLFGFAFTAFWKIRKAAKLATLSKEELDAMSNEPVYNPRDCSGGWKEYWKRWRKETASNRWVLVHGDVFRPPSTQPRVLVILVGSGAHLLAAGCIALAILCAIKFPQSQPGRVLSVCLHTYVGTSFLGGIVAGRCVQVFNSLTNQSRADYWPTVGISVCAYPTFIATMYAFLQEILKASGVQTTIVVDSPTLRLVWAAWAATAVLGLLGAQAARILFVRAWIPPTEINESHRDIPKHARKKLRLFRFLAGVSGMVSFGAVFVELFFCMGSMFSSHYYDSFGFLFLVTMVAISTTGLFSTMSTFGLLSFQDHRWWWPSFASGTSIGLLLFGYAFIFLRKRGEFMADDTISPVIYFGCMFCISLGCALACGAVNFLSSFYFVTMIYSRIAASD